MAFNKSKKVVKVQKKRAHISIDEAFLVSRARRGDTVAMEQLVIKHQDRIYNTILKICQNSHDAAELTQDTFVKFIEKINTFEQKSTLYTWLFRIAVNLTINHCKRGSKLGLQSLEAPVGPVTDGARKQLAEFLADESAIDPARLAENKEINQIVIKGLGKLDDQQRIIVVLRDIEQMSYARIASALEIELGTVKSRLSRARAKLKEILEAMLYTN